MSGPNAVSQQAVVDWFDRVYRWRGAGYLRPLQAYLVFPELLGVGAGDVLLDVACGPGLLLEAAGRATRNLHGIDLSPVAIEQARMRVPYGEFRVASAESLPYPDATFDLVTCLGSLERMLDAERALAEMWRVGKEQARYCFLVRNSNTRSWKYLRPITNRTRQRSHAGANTLANWRTLFESQRFDVVSVWPDQYPIHRRMRRASMFLKSVDFSRPVCSAASLDQANEFVFVLRKRYG